MKNTDQRKTPLESFLKNPSKSMWSLAIPIMAGMGIQTLYTIIDMIFIGRLGGDAIAAVAFNMPIFFLVMGLSFGLGNGVTASIARFIGADDKVNADNSAEHAVVMALLISAILTSLGLIYGEQILTFMGCTQEVLPQAWSYLRVSCYGISFGVFSGFFRSILAGEGEMKLPMIIAGLGTILNTILDPIFIFYLDYGVVGAAWATTISQIIVWFIFVYMLFIKHHTYIKFKLKDFSLSTYIIFDIIKVGIPVSMSMVVMAIGQLVFNRLLVNYSTNAVAAYQIGGRIDMLVFLPIFGIASALTTMVGMFYGANEISKIRLISWYGIKSSLIITSICSVILYIFAPIVISIFTADPLIQRISIDYLRIISILFPFISIGLTIGRILQGLGQGMPSLIITTIRVIGVAGPLAYYFTFIQNRPVEWIWYSMFISGIFATIISIVWVINTFRKLSIA
ncbi:MAG: MATE family efflux transporter [Candidatus Neomarinimicrobiota bacterium]|nr:MATE family efflux transporter [Candidatus Neomarinimicrobiota bacterium]MEC9437753.1 MATE family efflux transporter [Candidatus Neomarinimicrobiota bacterium]MED5433415.1 MATE family efflux transporter [Candidatus Neomarinimicrobiota bacterium]MEE3303173.1 MATE family efflux transporter [Candidatus Neomarinimicrobiota bacterium]|tara:strand:- start:491 stop:1849 length:1359 start_codon:yes stop_codon:yes gene_type:complete